MEKVMDNKVNFGIIGQYLKMEKKKWVQWLVQMLFYPKLNNCCFLFSFLFFFTFRCRVLGIILFFSRGFGRMKGVVIVQCTAMQITELFAYLVNILF